MTQTTLKALAAMALLIAATTSAQTYTGWQVGIWARTVTVKDREYRVKLEVKENTIHCTVRFDFDERPIGMTVAVDADYFISRDGTLVGILAPTRSAHKAKDKVDAKDDINQRVFTCRISPEKNALVVSDVSFNSDKEMAKLGEGKYHKVEAKSHLPTAPAVAPTIPAAALAPPTGSAPALDSRTSVRFVEPRGMKVSWMVPSKDGKRDWSDQPLEAPATYDFAQGAIYRLKLSNIENHPGMELYPTMEVVPATDRAKTFLAHSSVPVSFTAGEFVAAKSGKLVVKVISLSNSEFSVRKNDDGIRELTSTKLQPGVDPIIQAVNNGAILAVVRLGNIDGEKRPASVISPLPTLPSIPRVDK